MKKMINIMAVGFLLGTMRMDLWGMEPLNEAAWNGNANEVARLLRAGANPNTTEKCKRTPLHLAADDGHADVVEMLLSAGANPNIADENGHTPLHLAAYWGYTNIVVILLKAGANIPEDLRSDELVIKIEKVITGML